MAHAALIAFALLAADTPDCTVAKPALPADLAAWSQATEAAASPDAKTPPVLGAGRTRLALRPAAHVRFAATPERPSADGFAGLAAFEVAKAGRVRVALDQGAWVDVVQGGAPVKSVSHGHGPACSGIRKIVGFDLAPGRYVLQIVKAPSATVDALVIQP